MKNLIVLCLLAVTIVGCSCYPTPTPTATAPKPTVTNTNPPPTNTLEPLTPTPDIIEPTVTFAPVPPTATLEPTEEPTTVPTPVIVGHSVAVNGDYVGYVWVRSGPTTKAWGDVSTEGDALQVLECANPRNTWWPWVKVLWNGVQRWIYGYYVYPYPCTE